MTMVCKVPKIMSKWPKRSAGIDQNIARLPHAKVKFRPRGLMAKAPDFGKNLWRLSVRLAPWSLIFFLLLLGIIKMSLSILHAIASFWIFL